jgi:Uncharacterized protein conserved in bacteria (DUF2171)
VQERYLGHMEPGMDVCDMNGDKIGTVARVYRHEMAAVGVTAGAASPSLPENPLNEILEVKTGFLGFGRRLYVPLGDIQEVTQGCVFLSRGKNEIDDLDWDMRPDHLDQLT